MKVVILSKERVRRLSANDSYPVDLKKLNHTDKNIMDWNMCALDEFGIKDVVYVGGYHIEKVIHKYPMLRFYYYGNWEKRSEIECLLEAENEIYGDTIILTSNIIFRKEALEMMLGVRSNGFVIGGAFGQNLPEHEKIEMRSINGRDSLLVSLSPKADRSVDIKSFHFADMVYIPKGLAGLFIAQAKEILCQQDKGSLASLVKGLLGKEHKVHIVDVGEHWSSTHKSLSLAKFVMGSKAQTLERLRSVVKKSVILPQLIFTVEEWENDSSRIVESIKGCYGTKTLVVRSSATNEDSWESSEAGKFHSELNVDGNDSVKITNAIEKVIQSYNENGQFNKNNQVFVQTELVNVKVSGVLISRDLKTFAPYYVINYDRKSGRTDTVTSGQGIHIETKIVCRNYDLPVDNGWCDNIISAAREIEDLVAYDALNIEFALDKGDNIYFLQIRPMVIENEEHLIDDEDFYAEIKKIKNFVISRFKKSPYVYGSSNLLGEMPDWNPAEMIGSNPKPLSMSLYQKLITDWAWAESRGLCNYKNVFPEPLMFSLGGKPYIDVRNSFNSFLPLTLSNSVSEKLINYSLEYLKKNHEYHDKVEFEVMLNCYDFDFDNKATSLLNSGFAKPEVEEIRKCYLTLTDELLIRGSCNIKNQLGYFEVLKERRESIIDHSDSSVDEIPNQINWLLNDCVKYGIIPFSILARYAFISLILLRSLVTKKILSYIEYEIFLKNIPTIGTRFKRDLCVFQRGKISKDIFINKYAHLRPNSYDICSLNYAMRVERGDFANGNEGISNYVESNLDISKKLWKEKEGAIANVLKENGFTVSTHQLFCFITQSIQAREEGKFEFTKNLNAILEKVASMGSEMGFDREDMSYINIEKITRFATDSPSSVFKTELERDINYEKKRHNLTLSLRLPSLIDSHESLECFDLLKWKPNYITSKKTSGKIVDLSNGANKVDLTDKIVLIKGADPGFDWIFTKPIKGIITQYGGVGSHMAIRAAEFGIPAAIGCGEVLYNALIKANYVELNCGNHNIQIEY